MKAGAIDFIEKPFDDEVLINAIEASLAPAGQGDRADKTFDAARRLARSVRASSKFSTRSWRAGQTR
jgi:two-component system response regulator FixJ